MVQTRPAVNARLATATNPSMCSSKTSARNTGALCLRQSAARRSATAITSPSSRRRLTTSPLLAPLSLEPRFSVRSGCTRQRRPQRLTGFPFVRSCLPCPPVRFSARLPSCAGRGGLPASCRGHLDCHPVQGPQQSQRRQHGHRRQLRQCHLDGVGCWRRRRSERHSPPDRLHQWTTLQVLEAQAHKQEEDRERPSQANAQNSPSTPPPSSPTIRFLCTHFALFPSFDARPRCLPRHSVYTSCLSSNHGERNIVTRRLGLEAHLYQASTARMSVMQHLAPTFSPVCAESQLTGKPPHME